jgi:hypothetical protein
MLAVLLLVAALPWFFVVRTIASAKPIKSQGLGPPNSVVWANRVFSTEHELAVWLRSRGESYRGWANSHPALYRILSHQTGAPATRRAAEGKSPSSVRHKPTQRESLSVNPSQQKVSAFVRRLVWLLARIALIVVALALLGFALGPDMLIARIAPNPSVASPAVEIRVVAAAAGVALVTGVLAAYLLG